MKIFIKIALCMMLVQQAISQEKPNMGLKVGDQIPEVVLNMLNYGKKTADITSFKGKLLILDFWGTWCGSCVANMPAMQQLQDQFSKEIQILPVSDESAQRIQDFKKGNEIISDIRLPMVIDDVMLRKLFPYRSVPHVVWIDKNGYVKAITKSEMATADKVKAALNNDYSTFVEKKEVVYFTKKDTLLNVSRRQKTIGLFINSTFTRRLAGYGTGQGYSEDSSSQKIYCINEPILSLYNRIFKIANTKLVLEVKDPSRFFQSEKSKETWADDNLVCYELIVPKEMQRNKIDSLMLQDLNANLDYEARLEKRKTKCWVLQCTSKDSLFKTKGGTPVIDYNARLKLLTYRNYSLNHVIHELNTSSVGQKPTPVILDETKYKGNLDIVIPTEAKKAGNIQQMNENFSKYGLQLVPAEREVEMVVVREKGYRK